MGFFSGIGDFLKDNVGSLIGAGASLYGGESRNQAQEAQSAQQMAFQERMSNTAHQRQIKDLKAAGLNPILSAKYGGASSPLGSQAQIQDAISPAVSTAFQSKMIQAQVTKAKAEAVKATAEADNAKSQNANIPKQGVLLDQQAKNTKADTRKKIGEILNLRSIETKLKSETQNNYETRVLKKQEQILNVLETEIKNTADQTAKENLTQLKTRLARLKADEEFYETAGPIMKWIDKILTGSSTVKSLIK
tara:strand:+ start:4853 stop:5599 length:747 start_codon:yes stop_codon:yes gene_type:complete